LFAQAGVATAHARLPLPAPLTAHMPAIAHAWLRVCALRQVPTPSPSPGPDDNAGVNLEVEDAEADKEGSTPGGNPRLSEGQRTGASGGNGAAGVGGRR
jgi:hypothetical protein